MSSVSFVVPVFNKSLYLKNVINSVLSQKGDFDKEYIFIDDGSTDDSLKILKKETRGLKNCKIITQKNKGSANATNIGINMAKMKYIKFLDADDIPVEDAFKYIAEQTRLEYKITETAVIFTHPKEAPKLIKKEYSPNSGFLQLFSNDDDVVGKLEKMGITFPYGSKIRYHKKELKMTVTNTAENHSKLESLMKSLEKIQP